MGSSANAERREANRRRFNGTVELAFPEESECYEADAIDLSIGGMSLKTAFLPDVGSELDCRFVVDGSEPQTVQARAEVVWAKEHGGDAGSFGLRFKDMTRSDLVAVQLLCDPRLGRSKAKSSHAPATTQQPASAATPQRAAPNAEAKVSGAQDNIRLKLPTMPKPLKASLRSEAKDAMVVAMDLSFIELGGHVDVDRLDGSTSPGTLEGVDLDIDPHSHTARLVLTLALTEGASDARPVASAAHKPTAATREASARDGALKLDNKSPSPANAQAQTASQPALDEPFALKQPRGKSVSPGNTESLTSRDTLGEDDDNHGGQDAAQSDANSSSLASKSQNAAPAWLLSTMARVRGAGKNVWQKAGPALRKTAGLIAAFVMMIAQKARARVTGKPVVEAQKSTAAAPVRNGSKVTLRKQNPEQAPSVEAVSAAESSTAPSARRKFALLGLGLFGASAITFALVTGRTEPRPQTPRPQVAVNDSTSTASAPNALGASATPSGQPSNNGNAAVPGVSADEGTGESSEQPAPTAANTAGSPRMPSDLVAAARSRNANLEPEGSHPVRRVAVPVQANARTVAAHAPVATTPAAHAIGSAGVRTGTVLRLRCDGPIANIAGGAAGRDSITIRVAGRHIVDRAAGFVRMDSRIAGAGAYNHGANSEFTLRFHGTAPAFSARTRGDTLEVILAAPSGPTASAHVSPAANAHARIAALPTARAR